MTTRLPFYSFQLYFQGQAYTLQTTKVFFLLDLVRCLGYETNPVVLEYNKEICPTTAWSLVPIQHKDQVEILTIVGGG